MARPKKATVDYFPHDTNHGSTMQVLESKWGNDGYAFWFKLLELLGTHDNHFIDCRKPAEWEFLTAKTRLNDDTAVLILDMLARLDAIDPFLWQEHKVIFCPKFVDRISDAYRRRMDRLPTPEKVYSAANVNLKEFMTAETPLKVESDGLNRERERERERESKEEIPPTPMKMTMTDISFLFSDKFGGNMPRGCNNLAVEICTNYNKDEIIAAFETAAIQGKCNMAYVRGILMGNGNKNSNAKNRDRPMTFADSQAIRDMEQHRAFLEE